MEVNQLKKVIWPTSVDMMGQVVVAVTFFFLVIFIVLAYFLKQIELRHFVKVKEQTYQHLYEPFRKYLGSADYRRKEERRPNIDELVLQIRDYILSVPETRIKDIQSLIAKRDKLVSELYNLGYTSYNKDGSFTGGTSSVPLISYEELEPEGLWPIALKGKDFIVHFANNSLKPDQSSLETLRKELSTFLSAITKKNIIRLGIFDSHLVVAGNLSRQLSLRRAIIVRNLIREANVPKENVSIKSQGDSPSYLYGAISVSYE